MDILEVIALLSLCIAWYGNQQERKKITAQPRKLTVIFHN